MTTMSRWLVNTYRCIADVADKGGQTLRVAFSFVAYGPDAKTEALYQLAQRGHEPITVEVILAKVGSP